MNNLTTRKIVLGLLMTLVLAFSVQGTADALTSLRKATDNNGDGAIIRKSSTSNTFVFTIAGVNDATPDNDDADELTLTLSKGNISSVTGGTLAAATGVVTGLRRGDVGGDVTVTYNAPDTTGNITLTVRHTQKNPGTSTQSSISFRATVVGDLTLTKSTSIGTSHDHQVQVENRRLVNPLTFSISNVADADEVTIAGTTINRIVIGSTEVYEDAIGTNTVTLEADAESNNLKLINGTVKVYCTLGTAGTHTFTVSGTTLNYDDDDNMFTAYAVQSRTDVETTIIGIAFSPADAEIRYDTADQTASIALTTTTTHVEVEFGISGGSLYHPETPASNNFKTTTTSRLTRFTNSSGEAMVKFRPSSNANLQITAQVVLKRELEAVKTYYYRDAVLDKVSGDDQTGRPNTQLTQPLVVNVENQRGTGVSGQVVLFQFADPTNAFSFSTDGATERKAGTFRAVPGTTIYDATFTATNGLVEAEDHPSFHTAQAKLRVVSDRGRAEVYVVLSEGTGILTTATEQYYEPTATILRGTADDTAFAHRAATQRFKATADPGRSRDTRDIRIASGGTQNVAVRKYADPLVVIVESNGNVVQGATVTFAANAGVLEFDRDDNLGTPDLNGDDTFADEDGPFTAVVRGMVQTDASGRASVNYYVGDTAGVRKVDATIKINPDETPTTSETFTVNVGGARDTTTRDDPPPAAPTNTIGITLSSTTGEPGDEITVTVRSDPSERTVTLSSPDFADTLFSPQSGTTPFRSTLTLPDTDGEYDISAQSFPLTAATESVTVETGILGRISISQIGAPSGGAQSFSITVVDTDDDRISGALTVRVSGSGFTTRNVDTLNGIGNARLTLPTAAGTYTLTASADDYTSGTTQVRIAGTAQEEVADEDEEEEEVVPVSEPDSVSIVGPSQRDGTANTALDAALIVEVVDDDGDAVADARVIFRVRTGQGRLSDRGNGRAIAVQTNSSGHARATYTPISASSTVEAEVRGVTRSVTFTITASGGSTTPTTRDTGTGTTLGTISPTVLVGAANRAPMVWIDGGAIYSLVGASVERFAPSVDNAQNLAVGGGKIYWTEATGESGGTINAANLNGSGVTELAAILATPMGIAIDTAGSKLYWTNSRGKIQSANLNGSGITDVIPSGLEGAMDIALAGGNAYWTQGGNVRFVNLRGQKQIRNVSTGTDTAGSLAIAGGKVYWTEATGESGGTVNSANLNGSGATQLASILAAPSGIAVDTARSKLLWTNARGRIQSANLDGSGITNVVDGLGSPGDMVLSNSISAPAATTTTTTTTTADNSKYDVNGDGSVDNTDASLVAAAMNTTNAKYDVNSDGVVNFLDLLLVFDNRDATAAGAPTIVGMKLTAVQVDVLQEQINLLIATGDRSPAAMRTLVYLQQLIATARPEQTQLLANYPNPFNPETWIPYELATDTEVRITIYNTQGVVIRTLELGHQSSGYYVGRDRAAYWDGRNAFGEQVASGIYFYQFETDETSSMRKMVILK